MKINWKALTQWKTAFDWKLLGQQTINQRLAALFFVLIGGFILIAATYWGVVGLNNAAERTNARVSEFGTFVDRIQVGVLQARREEKDFFVRRKEEHLQQHERIMNAVYADVDKAQELAPDAESANLISDVRTHLRTYQGTFLGAAEAVRRAGFDENSGLQGLLGTAAQEIEDLLAQRQKTDLTASLLSMRRYEKDYIQRGNPKDIESMNAEQRRFASLLGRSDLPAATKELLAEKMKIYHGTFMALAASYRDTAEEARAFDSVVRRVEPILASLVKTKEDLLADNRTRHAWTTRLVTLFFVAMLVAITALVSFVVVRTRQSITRPLDRLTGTIAAITAGDREARVRLNTGDEMQQLGDALDRMMDERGRFMQTEAENERLNNSVIAILRSVSQLGKGDLTVQVPVHEDITGALGDAINHMAAGIGRTLGQVSKSSERLVATSKQTREITVQSRETVLSTTRGMNEIRATIQETAKRIKRLGERSQEIGGIVKLIDTIAERTNMLALNANMQAAQAGEAGRGFMVVAAEVQRLAENAKDATNQISKLVNNIQVETGDTIAAMDKAIEEVVEGSHLAEQAATQIKRNEEMVAMLDQLGAQLQEAVRAFTLPPEVLKADSGKSIKAVA